MTDKTITRAEADALRQAAWDANGCRQRFDDALVQRGYRIIDDASEAMGDKADAICDIAFPDGWNNDHAKGALAVLRYAVKVVEDAFAVGFDTDADGDAISRSAILRELGGEG